MSFWSDTVLPYIVDRGMRNDFMAQNRKRAAPLATGRVLDSWRNPYNDAEAVEVYHVRNDPQNSLWGATMPKTQLGDHHPRQHERQEAMHSDHLES